MRTLQFTKLTIPKGYDCIFGGLQALAMDKASYDAVVTVGEDTLYLSAKAKKVGPLHFQAIADDIVIRVKDNTGTYCKILAYDLQMVPNEYYIPGERPVPDPSTTNNSSLPFGLPVAL